MNQTPERVNRENSWLMTPKLAGIILLAIVKNLFKRRTAQ